MEKPGYRPDQKQPPTRQERRKKAREEAKAKNKSNKISRRNLLKMGLPGGWIPEAVKEGVLKTTEAKVSLAKDLGLAAVATGMAIPFVKEAGREKTLKEKVLAFTWKDAEDKEKLQKFVETLALEYLKLTKTPRLQKDDLVGQGRTNFYQNRSAFADAVRTVQSDFNATQNQWGYTHYSTGKVFIDFESLKKQAIAQGAEAGQAFLDALWHEWGHLDVEPRKEGKYINNPKALLLAPSPNLPNEIIRSYRGGEMKSDNYTDYQRFDEVWNETITIRRMIEQVGLDAVVGAGDYNENGIDFFPKFTFSANISLDALYEMHAASDFEGFANIVGEKLPGADDPFLKGERLFNAINKNDPGLIKLFHLK